MSINVNYNECIGYCNIKSNNGKVYSYALYEGNAYLIALAMTDEYANLQWFFIDKMHAKRCLGLDKKYDCINMLEDMNFILINKAKYKKCSELTGLLVKANYTNDLTLRVVDHQSYYTKEQAIKFCKSVS